VGIVNKMRKQNAIYWPLRVVDDSGRDSHGQLVELVLTSAPVVNYRVRWEAENEEFLDPAGTTRISNAIVYLPLLPDGNEVEVGGILWLGDRADLTKENTPRANAGAFTVRRFDKMPNLKATEFLRTAYL